MRAMTFVELIVTIAVLMVACTALFDLIQSFYKDNSYLIEETSALADARRGVTTMITSLRQASYGDDGSYPIASAATSSMTIYSNGDLDTSTERLTFSLQNGVLYEKITNSTGTPPTYPNQPSSTTTIAMNVRNTSTTPLFTYFDDSGNQLSATSTNVSAISSVKVQLLIDLNPTRLPNVFTLIEQVTLRNLQKQ